MCKIEDLSAFRAEWNLCEKNPSRRRDALYQMMLPHIESMINQLVNPEAERTHEYFSFLAGLMYDTLDESYEVLNAWVEENREELHSYLWQGYTYFLDHPADFEWNNTDRQWAKYVAMWGRLALTNKLIPWMYKRHLWQQGLELCPYIDQTLPSPMVDDADDLTELRIRISQLPNYEHYLVSLYLLDYERADLEAVTGSKSSFVYFWSNAINGELKAKDIRKE